EMMACQLTAEAMELAKIRVNGATLRRQALEKKRVVGWLEIGYAHFMAALPQRLGHRAVQPKNELFACRIGCSGDGRERGINEPVALIEMAAAAHYRQEQMGVVHENVVVSEQGLQDDLVKGLLQGGRMLALQGMEEILHAQQDSPQRGMECRQQRGASQAA